MDLTFISESDDEVDEEPKNYTFSLTRPHALA